MAELGCGLTESLVKVEAVDALPFRLSAPLAALLNSHINALYFVGINIDYYIISSGVAQYLSIGGSMQPE